MSNNILPLLIMIGGGIGAVTRYVIGVFLMKKFQTPLIPIAMIMVNIFGSFALGIIYGIIYDKPGLLYNNTFFITIGIGFLGAFTTFSTFSVETVQLIKDKLYKKASTYITVSIIGSILAFAFAFYLIKF